MGDNLAGGPSPFPWLLAAYQVRKAKSQSVVQRTVLLREGFAYRAGGRETEDKRDLKREAEGYLSCRKPHTHRCLDLL